jgi:hypothetical protein
MDVTGKRQSRPSGRLLDSANAGEIQLKSHQDARIAAITANTAVNAAASSASITTPAIAQVQQRTLSSL